MMISDIDTGLVALNTGDRDSSGRVRIDLTGGLGIDAFSLFGYYQ